MKTCMSKKFHLLIPTPKQKGKQIHLKIHPFLLREKFFFFPHRPLKKKKVLRDSLKSMIFYEFFVISCFWQIVLCYWDGN